MHHISRVSKRREEDGKFSQTRRLNFACSDEKFSLNIFSSSVEQWWWWEHWEGERKFMCVMFISSLWLFSSCLSSTHHISLKNQTKREFFDNNYCCVFSKNFHTWHTMNNHLLLEHFDERWWRYVSSLNYLMIRWVLFISSTSPQLLLHSNRFSSYNVCCVCFFFITIVFVNCSHRCLRYLTRNLSTHKRERSCMKDNLIYRKKIAIFSAFVC
jgi:hypothetical protein